MKRYKRVREREHQFRTVQKEVRLTMGVESSPVPRGRTEGFRNTGLDFTRRTSSEGSSLGAVLVPARGFSGGKERL